MKPETAPGRASPSDRTVISPPKHSEASWAESKDLTSASLNRYLRRGEVEELLLLLLLALLDHTLTTCCSYTRGG